jgi:hypothetical protein
VLIDIHALADEACAGFGLIAAPPETSALAHCLANLLLTVRGSLSSLAKHHGVVLPKMRTPQSGVSYRSMSHHLTFHSSEVEVMWRAVPWANVQENTVNCLAVPWPLHVEPKSFVPDRDYGHHTRYFSFKPEQVKDSRDVDRLVRLIEKVSADAGRLHLVVLPELALSWDEYHALLSKLLASRRKRADPLRNVPMILAGVRNEENDRALNEIYLAVFFAGRWYQMSQRKHHRWKLNRSQVRQYSLQDRLATARDWYESIPIEQRRLTVLAPTGWLALCPLICEDLAQYEPVSDLIRGIGPTLVLALLLDGPQLKERWSARYASVLADDPGSAVLTLTSAGMVRRSKRLEEPTREAHSVLGVALWKDQADGWQLITLDEKCHGFVLTLSAEWTEEDTLDRRSDHCNAARFRFDGVQQVSAEEPSPMDMNAVKPQQRWFGDWSDIRELTATTFVIDALISTRGRDHKVMLGWLQGDPWHDPVPRRSGLVNLAVQSQHEPRKSGVLPGKHRKWPSKSLAFAIPEIGKSLAPDKFDPTFKRLLENATSQLADSARIADWDEAEAIDSWDKKRVHQLVPLIILSVLHNRLDWIRRRSPAIHGARRSSDEVELRRQLPEILNGIEKVLAEYL